MGSYQHFSCAKVQKFNLKVTSYSYMVRRALSNILIEVFQTQIDRYHSSRCVPSCHNVALGFSAKDSSDFVPSGSLGKGERRAEACSS